MSTNYLVIKINIHNSTHSVFKPYVLVNGSNLLWFLEKYVAIMHFFAIKPSV